MQRTTTVLVADDHVGLATAMTRCLGEHYRTQVAVNTPGQLRSVLHKWRDREGWKLTSLVVLLDISFGPESESGLELLADLVTRCPEARYVMYSMHGTRVFVGRALELGAAGFVDKRCGLSELRQAIDAAVEGKAARFTSANVGGGGITDAETGPATNPGTPSGAGAAPSRAETARDRGTSRGDAISRGSQYHEAPPPLWCADRRTARLAPMRLEVE